jgi:stage II sporulation protein P
LKNPHRTGNLAFSLQIQLAAAEQSEGLMRRIFLRSYRYNLHYRDRSVLIEAGAQTNTVEELKNAMVPLAKALDSVLTK